MSSSTISSYLSSNPQYANFVAFLKAGKSADNKTSYFDLLNQPASQGSYAVFVPNNLSYGPDSAQITLPLPCLLNNSINIPEGMTASQLANMVGGNIFSVQGLGGTVHPTNINVLQALIGKTSLWGNTTFSITGNSLNNGQGTLTSGPMWFSNGAILFYDCSNTNRGVSRADPMMLHVDVFNNTTGTITLYQAPYNPSNPILIDTIHNNQGRTYSRANFKFHAVGSACSNLNNIGYFDFNGIKTHVIVIFGPPMGEYKDCGLQVLEYIDTLGSTGLTENAPIDITSQVVKYDTRKAPSRAPSSGIGWLWWILLIIVILLIIWWIMKSNKITLPVLYSV